MTIKQIEAEILQHANESEKSFGKVAYLLKKGFDEWALQELSKQGHPNFKMMYMPFLMNISLEGNTNQDIAKRGKVSKQAMSKVVQELEALGLITTIAHKLDKRSLMIQLTTKGKKLVYMSITKIRILTTEYKQAVGAANFKIMIVSMQKIIAWHDSKIK